MRRFEGNGFWFGLHDRQHISFRDPLWKVNKGRNARLTWRAS
jgi:hypothetical protein